METPHLDLPVCDLTRRSVRVLQKRANGFVDFEFSVGWPELTVELAMTEADFQAFCHTQKATVL
ncbi:phenol hydroxylase subunit [Comamonas sp. GB3 AK4-5]|uniref:phenol hydroxylase subunit n=1 Tax=Comamonas sp. GB3 AK4-5 TaxID=3231487 RepID=UPI00351F1AB4